jgi:hypothetical protein
MGGVIVIGRAASNFNILAKRIDSNGVSLWDTAGIVASTLSNVVSVPHPTSDLASGVIISWKYGADVYSQRVDSIGVVQWGPDGIVVCDFPASKWPGVPVTDGTGGAIIYWSDFRFSSAGNPNDWFAQRISSTGVVMWDSNGVPISLRDGEQGRGGIISDGFGGAILAWEDIGIGWWDVYAQNVHGDGTLGPVGVEESNEEYRTRNIEFRLMQNQPNPFSKFTAIRYQLRAPAQTSLKIYDVSGRLVETLVEEGQEPGVYHVKWDGSNQASGIYYYQLQSGEFQTSRKVILLR